MPMSGCQIEKLLNQKRFRFQARRFWPETKKRRPVVVSPKKRFDPLKNCDLKLLSLKDLAEAINKVSPQSILRTLRYPNQRWVLSENLFQQKLFNLKKWLAYLMSLICLKI